MWVGIAYYNCSREGNYIWGLINQASKAPGDASVDLFLCSLSFTVDISRTATLDFWRVDFGPFRSLVVIVPWEAVLQGKGVQEGWIFFKKHIPGKAGCSWLGWAYCLLGKSWLDGQTKGVVVNGVKYNWWLVTNYVPQGSVLGVVLFCSISVVWTRGLTTCLLWSVSLLQVEPERWSAWRWEGLTEGSG